MDNNNNFNQDNNGGFTQPQYEQPQYNNYNAPYQQGGSELEPPMSLGDWIITLVVLAIPCVNIIMLFVWGFGQGSTTTKKNFCRAYLIFLAIGLVISIIFSSMLTAMLAGLGSMY